MSQECMKRFIIVLDGPKGSGKTTISAEIKKQLSNIQYLSLDELRRSIPKAKATADFNQQAFGMLLEEVTKKYEEGSNIIIDCGLVEQKLQDLEVVVKALGAKLYKYSLVAPFEVLLERVKQRDIQNGKETDEKRFTYLYDVLQAKAFTGYTVFDTHKLSLDDIVEQIIRQVKK